MPSGRRTSRRRSALLWLLVPLAALLGLGVLALGLRDAPGHAERARDELVSAREALDAGEAGAAAAAVARARSETDALQDSVQGIGGDVWSLVPVAGGPVRDVRRLGNAMDQLVAVAETGVRVWPQVRGDESTLVRNGNVDLDVLAEVTTDLREVSTRLEAVQSQLEGVADARPLVGTRLGDARDRARDEVAPLVDGLDAVDPLLDELPRMLGGEDGRQYLVALLNPAEMLPSGGTPQTFMTMGFDGGRLTLGETVDLSTAPGAARPRYWRKVKGNPFHRGRMKPALATMAPDWSVSGNELANAWRSLRGRRLSGVVVIDVVALSRLVALTGPLDVPELGTLTGDNLVEKLIGSYDDHPDPAQRKAVNRAIAPVFAERLLSGNDPVGTGRVLGRAAQERRFAVYLRNPDEQAAFDDLGLTGRLSATDRDYLGVFTQNRVPSKSDYWQRRAVRSQVTIREDGSASVTLRVEVHNDSPAHEQPGPDPGEGYFTRWNTLSILPFLPHGATFDSVSVDGTPVETSPRTFYGRYFVRPVVELAPQARHTLEATYVVPTAAVSRGESLVYGLDLDPQGMVDPQSVEVRVRFPRGFSVADDLPDGWSSPGGRVATYRTDGLEASESFEIPAHP